jgi:hypothetical protein
MTTYIQSFPTLAGVPSENLQVVELRTISNLLQREAPNAAQEELRIYRNDQAFELGIVPTTIPGN